MDAAEVRTAAEVERLTPDERQRLVNERSSTDLSEVPEGLLAKARAEGRRRKMSSPVRQLGFMRFV